MKLILLIGILFSDSAALLLHHQGNTVEAIYLIITMMSSLIAFNLYEDIYKK